jgi:hypothetical protein
MEYRYAPIYKYLAILVIFFLFLNHYKSIRDELFLPIVVIFITVIIIIDHMVILNHPRITADNKEHFEDELMEKNNNTYLDDNFTDTDTDSKLYTDIDSLDDIEEEELKALKKAKIRKAKQEKHKNEEDEDLEYTIPRSKKSCKTCAF